MISERRSRDIRLNPESDLISESIIANRMWLAGIFEIGGYMALFVHHKNDKGRVYTYGEATITINDNDLETMNKLQVIIGGTVIGEKKSNSCRLRIGRSELPLIAEAIEPYSPSRTEFTSLAKDWNDINTDERIERAQEFISKSLDERRQVDNPDCYKDLVKDPKFLAGVLDARGRFAVIERKGQKSYICPRIVVYSKNRQLLETLKGTYGGSINYSITGSTEKTGLSVFWIISHGKAGLAYRLARPNMKLKYEEGDVVFPD